MVQRFDDYDLLLERVDFSNKTIRELYDEHFKPVEETFQLYPIYRDLFLQDPNTEVSGERVIECGAYSYWLTFNGKYFYRSGHDLNRLDYKRWLVVVKADPTTMLLADGGVKKMGDVSKWLLNKFYTTKAALQSRFLEDLYKATGAIKKILANKSKLQPITLPAKGDGSPRIINNPRDFNGFKTLVDLLDYADTIDGGDKTKGEMTRDIKDDGSIKVYEDSNVLLVIPKTKEAAQYYGANTRWCTASNTDNKFDEYTKNGEELYITIFKKLGDVGKFQFQFDEMQFMDSKDEDIDLPKFVKTHEMVTEQWCKYFTKNINNEQHLRNLSYFDFVNKKYIPEVIKNNKPNITIFPKQHAIEYIIDGLYPKESITKLFISNFLYKESNYYVVYPHYTTRMFQELFDDDGQMAVDTIIGDEYYEIMMPYYDGYAIETALSRENIEAVKNWIISLGLTHEDEPITVDTFDDYPLSDILDSAACEGIMNDLQNAANDAVSSATRNKNYDSLIQEIENSLGEYVHLDGADMLFKKADYSSRAHPIFNKPLEYNIAIKLDINKLSGIIKDGYDYMLNNGDEYMDSKELNRCDITEILVGYCRGNGSLSYEIKYDAVNLSNKSVKFNEEVAEILPDKIVESMLISFNNFNKTW